MPAERQNATPELPTRRRSLLDELTADLLRVVRSGGYREGDKLPTLAVLAKQFGVATPTLREAVRRLEDTGILTTRHGSGVYVTGADGRLVIANPVREELAASSLLEVLDARLLLEPDLAKRAALGASAEGVARLHSVLVEAGRLTGEAITAGVGRELSALTMRFHVTVAELAGNQVLSQALESIVELYADQQIDIGRLFDDVERDHAEHLAIFEAIRHRNAHRARRLMEQHLSEVLDVVRTKLERAGSTIDGVPGPHSAASTRTPKGRHR